jgi:hypothetical protein
VSAKGRITEKMIDETVHRIEDAPSGLQYVMRRHGSVFYRERGSRYLLDVPKRTRTGREDHREYQQWSIEKSKVELMTRDLDCGMPPLDYDAEPVKSKPARSLKRGAKRLG